MNPSPLLLGGLVALGLASAHAQPVPSAESTLLLTWFDAPSTSMAVQWLTEGDVPPRSEGSATLAEMSVPALGDALTFDGNADDWGVQGLRIDYLAQPDGGWPDPDGGSAVLKLGWTPDGLAVLVTVTDDELLPAALKGWNRQGDRIELRLTGQPGHPGDGGVVNVAVGLGETGDPGEPAATAVLNQYGGADPVVHTAALARTDDGYTAEVLLPWGALPGFTAEDGARCGFQIEVHDADDGFDPERIGLLGYAYPNQSYRRAAPLVLAPAGRLDAVRARAELRHDPDTRARMLEIGGEPRLIGETVTVKSGGVTVAKVLLERVRGFAGAELVLPEPWGGPAPTARLDAVTLELDGRTLAHANLDVSDWAVAPAPGVVTAADGETAPPTLPAAEVLPFGDSGWFLHRVRFSGLEPGTDYAVAVPGRLAPVRFRTAPATLDEPLVFAEGGDVGTSHHVGQLHDEAAAWDPLFALVGGDCAYANGVDHETWFDYLKLWNDHLTPVGGRSVPMIAAIGNHEVIGSYGKSPEAAPFFHALFGPAFSPRGHYGVLDFGIGGTGATPYASFLLLDSGHTHAHGGRQTEWLDTALTERADVAHRFAAYHVPAYPSHRPFKGKMSGAAREHWVPLFEQHRVDAVFEHHDHTYKRTHRLIGDQPDPNGVLYLGDGCWGRTPRKVDKTLRPYLAVAKSERNVMRVTLNPDGTQDVLAVNEHGQVLDEIHLDALASEESRTEPAGAAR